MGHNITALVIAEPWREEARARFDLPAVQLTPEIAMFHITHYYGAYWQAKLGWRGTLSVPRGGLFPDDAVLAHIAAELVGYEDVTFGIIVTEYFGGAGEQRAALYKRTHRITDDDTISVNAILKLLGVECADGLDEWDTVGLASHRSTPSGFYSKYEELCDEIGV
ncbi:MAG: hypothetical protein QM831_33980 [Kofleriaceae bacterium]